MKQTAQPLAATDVAGRRANFLARLDDGVIQALMIPFRVVMHKVLANSDAQRFFAEKDYFRQTLGFDASHKSLNVGVQIGALWRKPDRFGTLVFDDLAESRTELSIPVHQQVVGVVQKAILAICFIHVSSGLVVQPAKSTRRVLTSMTNNK